MKTLIISDAVAQRIDQHVRATGQTVEQTLVTCLGLLECSTIEDDESRHFSRAYLQGILDSHIDLVCRYTPDTTLTYVNDAYCQFFGRQRSELLGKSFLIFAPEEDQRQLIFARIAELQAHSGPAARIVHGQTHDGNDVWIEWVDNGIVDSNNKLFEIQAVGRDITNLIRIQMRLIERENILSTIFHNIPIFMAQFDEQGRFEYVNKHWIDTLGWTVEEMRAHPDIMAEFYPDPEYRHEVLEYMLSLQPGWRDFKTRTRDGTLLDTSWANVRLSKGHTLGIGQVITQRKQLEDARVRAHQLELDIEKERELREIKDRFVSMVSHEFRTPLAAIRSSIDMIIHYFDRLTRERIIEKLNIVNQQVQRMNDLMEDVLRFSRLRSGKATIRLELVDVLPLCLRVVESFKLASEDHRPIEVTGEGGRILTDVGLLEHVLTNLISNAIKYSAASAPVYLTIERLVEHIQFQIRDSGIGIPEQDISHLFEPFYRASNAREIPGTGLGLSIVHDCVTQLGGVITVESSVGVGTTFTVTLPAGETPAS